jgi:hypothetical protein
MEREIPDHASKRDDQLIALKTGLRVTREKLSALQSGVLLEFKIPKQEILYWFRRALVHHDRLLPYGICSR